MFDGVSDTHTGNLNSTHISSWTLTANGVVSLSGTGANINANFSLSSGAMQTWSMQAFRTIGSVNYVITSVYNGSGYDTASSNIAGVYQAAIWANPFGTWVNPRLLGRPRFDPAIPNWTPPNPAAPVANNCPENKPEAPPTSCGAPIDIASGNMFEEVLDYTTVGQNPLAFIRYYNSMAVADTYATSMGRNWRHNYDRYLRVLSANEVDAERPDGKVVTFIDVSGTWTPSTDTDMTLTGSGSSYTLTDSNSVAEAYTVASGKGTLDTITWPSGYTQTLAYSSGNLSTVTDSYSRVLTMTFTGSELTGVSTPDAATLTYAYATVSGAEQLTSVTYNTSPSTNQTYTYSNTSFPYALTGITDENGNSYTSWIYDTKGRCTSSQRAGGADYTQVAYPTGTTRTVTHPLNEVLTYTFTTSQGTPKVTSMARAAASPVASATRTFTYDGNGYLATATDWIGNETRWTNNSKGLPTSTTDAYGTGLARTTTVSYDSNCPRKPEVITKTNLIVTNDWDNTTCDLLSTEYEDDTGGSTDGSTEVWTYTYSDYGLLATVTEPRTDTTITTSYDYTDGVLASITNDLSQVTTINTFTDGGRPTQVTDANSVVTDFTYDNRMRMLTKTVNAGTDEVTTITYIDSGQPDVITLPDSSTIDYDYDNAQRLTKITNTAGETINYTLNAMGRPTTVTIKDSGGNTKKSWTATYDVLGNMLTHVGAAGANETTSFAYNKMSLRTSVTDARSNVTSQAWDALLRPTTVTDDLTKTATTSYNNLDYVTAQTDFLTYSTTYTRDGFGNAIARSSPDTGSWTFGFDENNNLTDITDARSVVSALTYDALNRLTARSITGYSGEAEAFTYDATAGGNKGVGRLTSWSDESGSGSRVYDNFGNILTDTRVIAGQTYTTTYAYDLANRITEIIYPSGRYVNYTYDSSGYLTTVTTKPNAGGGVTNLATSIVHKPFGPIASFTFGNSEAHTRTYSNNYWLTDLDTVYSGTYVQQLDFGYDYAGNLTSITDNIDNTRNETLTIDALNRLSGATGKYGTRTYTYNDNSGRATKVISGGVTYTTTRVSNKNRVDNLNDGTNQRDFTWTANGNMATDDRAGLAGGAVANTFGGRDRLESQTVNSVAVTFKVNAFDQRVSKAFSGTTTHYVYGIGGQILADANGSNGATITEYVWMEGQLLAQIDSGGNIVYVHNSHIGNPQKITNPSRTLVWDRIIEPFGEIYSTPTNTTPTVHRFPGQIFDSENGLHYNNFRDYDPTMGLYVQADPIGLVGGFNPFTYANSNPTQWIDPSGLDAIYGDPSSFPAISPRDAAVAFGILAGAVSPAAVRGAWGLVRGAPARTAPEQYGPPRPPQEVARPPCSPEQQANIDRFVDKLPANARDSVTVRQLPNGGVAAQGTSPGRVPGSSAVYEKQIGSGGQTLDYTKTTYDPQGNIVNVKNKITGGLIP